MWVFGADAILSCPTWLEIKREVLKLGLLTNEEKQELNRIRAYAGSREMSNLFESAVLRAAGIFHIQPTKEDTIRAAVLALPLKESDEAQPGSAIRPQKCLRAELGPAEAEMMAASTAEIAARLAGSSATAQAERQEKKKRRMVRSRNPHGSAEPAQNGTGEVAEANAPIQIPGVSQDRSVQDVPSVEAPEVLVLDEASPAQSVGREAVKPIEAEVRVEGETAQAPLPEPAHKPSKEPAEASATAEEWTAPPLATEEVVMMADAAPAPGGDSEWSIPHRIEELDPNMWGEVRAMLICSMREHPRCDREPSADYWFTPKWFLDKRSSVLESRIAQAQALEQFCLERDDEILSGMPSVGLHHTLKGYLLRGALVEQELFSRLKYMQGIPAKLQEELGVEKASREEAEKRVGALEAERATWSRSENIWRRKLETRDKMIEGLQAHRTQQSTTITKLKEEIGHLQHDILERDGWLKYLEDELEIERRDCGIAYERAQGARREVENLQVQLKEEADAHEKLKKEAARTAKEVEGQRVEMQTLQGRLSHLKSKLIGLRLWINTATAL